jgi:nucleoside-diphosphate-sugar epimerase
MISGARIVVTGGAGFIASHIIDRLVEKNRIVIYDNMKRNAFRFSPHHDHKNVTVVEGDVLDAPRLEATLEGADIVVHAAAIAGIYSVGDSITRTMKVNLIGAYNALEAAVKHKVPRFIDFSTSEIYGPFSYRSREEDLAKVGPASEKRWIYAISKLAAEHFAHAYADDFGIKVVTVRPFNVYGPRQVGEGAVQQMVGRALANADITVFNDGSQIRSWCFVDDFADAFVSAMHLEAAMGQVFNIGNPQATTTVLGLAETLIRLTGSKSKIVFKPHPGPEVEIRMPDIGKARRLLAFEPKVGLDEGLNRSIEWYRQHSK